MSQRSDFGRLRGIVGRVNGGVSSANLLSGLDVLGKGLSSANLLTGLAPGPTPIQTPPPPAQSVSSDKKG